MKHPTNPAWDACGRARSVLCFALTIIGLAWPVMAHAANVSGRIFDVASGTYLNGAIVRVEGTDLRAVSDNGGRYILTGVPAGRRTLRISYFGFSAKTETVEVGSGGASLDVTFGDDLEELEAFVVEGQLVGQARALNLQKSSAVTASIVSADAIGEFPDENAAEALNRLPGISIERDQGEGRFVVIRGINPDLNSFAIDGVKLAAPGADERATLLDTIPSDTLERLEVHKAVLPSMPGDSVGGHINIATPSAFDYDTTVARMSLQTNYSDLRDEWEGKINGSYGDVFKEGTLGFMISASYGERTLGSDNNESDPFVEEDGDDGSSGLVFEEMEYREYNLTRIRTGISANFEARPNDDSIYFARVSYNDFEDTEIRNAAVFEVDGFDAIGSDSFIATGTEHVREFKDREESMRVIAASIGGENVLGPWTIDYRLSYSKAEEDTPYDFEAIYELADVVDVRYSGTNTNVLRIEQLAGPDFTDPANYEFDEVETANQLVEEDDVSVEANASYAFENRGVLKQVKVGALSRFKSKDSDAEVFVSDDNPVAVEDFGANATFGRRDAFGTGLPYVAQDFRSTFLENEPVFAVERELADSSFEDFQSDEDVIAAYIQLELSASEWDIILGARVEDTDFETRGFAYNDDTETVEPTRGENSYTSFLPGIHFRRGFGDEMVFRFSAHRAIARPNFAQTLPGAEIEDDEVSAGNPELDPLEATNLDASFEYYMPPLGVFTASVFYKDVEDFIYEQTLTRDFAGISDAELTTFRNGPSGSLIGLELGVQQQFSGALEGFGVQANIAFIDGEADVLGAEEGDPMRELAFIKQSETVGNVALTYEDYGFFFRIAASFRDQYLDEVGESPEEDRYVDDYFQVDISSRYRFNDDFSVFANFLNITNEPFEAFWGETGRLSQFEEYGWSANFGLKYSY